jgi:predicted small metal-binding protein
MYEFVCDRIIPGCNYTETADTKDEARKKGRQHLEDHHPTEISGDPQRIGIDIAIAGLHR